MSDRKPQKDTVKGPVSGGVHTFKEKRARPDPLPKVHTAKRGKTSPNSKQSGY